MISVLKWTNLHFFHFFSAWLITTLVILLIYLCTRCCDTKSTKHRKSRPIRCLLSFFALVTTAGLAGGFWGNHVLHGGMEEFQTATQKIVEHVRHIQEMSKRYNEALQVCRITHGPLLLDRSVCLPLFAMWPSFGYFSTVI